jgi:hypothetical protein
MSTEMYVDPRLARPDEGDGDTYTHVVRGLPGQDPAALVKQAYANGTVLVALCGHRWIPSKDPRKYPVCQPCLAELERMRLGG